MNKLRLLTLALVGGASAIAVAHPAFAKEFNIPSGDLTTVLSDYMRQAGVAIIYSNDAVRGHESRGARGDYTETAALAQILKGTGFATQAMPANAIGIVPVNSPNEAPARIEQAEPIRVAAAATSVETVVVTSSKIKGDIQTVPIAITALSQEQLTSRQIAGGPDLVKEVPNLTFTKTNFSGYSIQIRGIGTQAISVTTDPAVAVALNDIPFIRNHFFEQEFFDVNQVEVLRGPQGTLYGRNATAGVVNVISAKPTDQFEAMLSADWGNYTNRRYEGMVNIPLVDDRLGLRVAGEWTKRDGYTTNQITGSPIDGRDLWSIRATLAWKPSAKVQTWLVWEHFNENDDRLRSSKQLCKTDPTPTEIGGVPVPRPSVAVAYSAQPYLSQGCSPVGLYDKGDPSNGDYGAFGVPNGISLAYYEPLGFVGVPVMAANFLFDPYASESQSTNLRVIESTINPRYLAKNDTLEFNADYAVTPELTFTSQTGYNNDFLWSTEDYNRFNTRPGAFQAGGPLGTTSPLDPNNGICTVANAGGGACAGKAIYDSCSPARVDLSGGAICAGVGTFCDPQLGCADRLVAQDLDVERAWQLSQEFRLASNFTGPFNFSVGGNYLHYETNENYYVFINSLTLASYSWDHAISGSPEQTLPWVPGVSDNSNCINGGLTVRNPKNPSVLGGEGNAYCMYIDPNPLGSLNNEGHNYFLSQNPYTLNSYAGFGEAYYNVTHDLKLTGGIRWTEDKKHFTDIPSELLVGGYGYPVTGVVDQEWNELTGRAAVNWTPKLDFTDQTLVYGSYAHGYKAGGANPPGATLIEGFGVGVTNPIHPFTFKPEFIDAYELGTKNTLADGGITLNGDVFFYNYKGYQISRIVDRTAINDNFDATVRGAELEAMWEPIPGLKFNFAGGYEATRIDNGQSSIDLMDRADVKNHPDWMVLKPFVTQASNCILPVYVVAAIMKARPTDGEGNGTGSIPGSCANAYQFGLDPVTDEPYKPNPVFPTDYNLLNSANDVHNPGPYPGFDPTQPAINNGEGFAKNLGGHELPNAPHFTTSLSADYTIPMSEDWAATLHSDFYWQSQSWARVFNDRPYDKIRGYSTTNLALILTSASGWQVMGYVKNVFDVTAITGDFLNSDDSGLTTNVFLTDPRLFGVRVTKNW